MNDMNELSLRYKASCRKELQKDIDELIRDFIFSEEIDEIYKDKVISMIVTLLTLK